MRAASSVEAVMTLGAEFVADRTQYSGDPQAKDESTCYSCFLVRHRSQLGHKRTATRTAPNPLENTTRRLAEWRFLGVTIAGGYRPVAAGLCYIFPAPG